MKISTIIRSNAKSSRAARPLAVRHRDPEPIPHQPGAYREPDMHVVVDNQDAAHDGSLAVPLGVTVHHCAAVLAGESVRCSYFRRKPAGCLPSTVYRPGCATLAESTGRIM